MRSWRTLIVLALALSAAAVPIAVDHAAALATAHTALTLSRDPLSGDVGHAVAYDASNATMTVTGGSPTATFPSSTVLDMMAVPPVSGLTDASPARVQVIVANATLTVGDGQPIQASPAGDGVHVWVNGCESSGTIDVLELSAPGGTVDSFAADFTTTCTAGAGYPTVQGSVRWNSSAAFDGVMATPLDWDFGNQPVKTKGTAKKFTFRNIGSDPITFGAASITGSLNAVSISANGCSQHSVAAGASCSITVVPHPQRAVSGTYPGSTNVLHLPAASLPTPLAVPLRVEGVPEYPNFARGGPGYVTFSWEKLGGPIPYFAQRYRVYRGTSADNLTFLRTDTSGYNRIVDRTVITGRTYFYAAQPVYNEGQGQLGPVVAAIAWPKYTSGMYHRLPRHTRFVDNAGLRAGHPLSVPVLGRHGVPGGGVSAVALDLTVAGASTSTSVRVFPAGTRQPGPADLTLQAGGSQTNLVLATVGRGGRILISTSAGTARVDVDVTGYFSGRTLAHRFGKGGALQEYAYPGTIMDTKGFGVGALKHGFYIDTPVNFSTTTTPHVTSLLVEVSAYGSDGAGTISGFQTNGRATGTSVLTYHPHQWTSNTTIIPAGLWYSSNQGRYYPSVSFLNRGPKPVQLVVSILGFFDDDTLLLGCRYKPTAPFHLFGATMHGGSTIKFNPGSRHANHWSFTFNTKITAAHPTRTTSLSIKAIGGGAPPAHGQVHAEANHTTTSTTLPPTGVDNDMSIHNAAGTVRVDLWSFGRFDAWPVPRNANSAALAPAAALAPTAAPSTAATRAAVRFS